MKTLLIILFISASNLCYAQQHLSKVSKLIEPQKAKALTVNEGLTYVKENFSSLSIPIKMENVYLVDNIVVSFQDYKVAYPVDLKTVQDRSYDKSESYFQKKIKFSETIQKYKFQDFFIETHSKNDEVYYWFRSEQKDLKGVEGCVAFKQKDAEKAKMILDNLLNSIELK